MSNLQRSEIETCPSSMELTIYKFTKVFDRRRTAGGLACPTAIFGHCSTTKQDCLHCYCTIPLVCYTLLGRRRFWLFHQLTGAWKQPSQWWLPSYGIPLLWRPTLLHHCFPCGAFPAGLLTSSATQGWRLMAWLSFSFLHC